MTFTVTWTQLLRAWVARVGLTSSMTRSNITSIHACYFAKMLLHRVLAVVAVTAAFDVRRVEPEMWSDGEIDTLSHLLAVSARRRVLFY